MHYQRQRAHGSFDLPPRQPAERIACRGGGCTGIVTVRSKSGLCRRCFRREWYRGHREHEREGMARWRAEHHEYDRRRRTDYYLANSERLRQNNKRRYYADHSETLARAAAWREANRERLRAQGAEQRRNNPNWPLRNRENALRRAKAPDGSKVDYAAILAEHGMTCHICGDSIATRSELHFDHVIPLARGGAHAADNIRPAHAICNMRKGARTA